MKTNKLTCLLAFGLMLALTVTGCNKRPVGTTPIPGTAGAPKDEGMKGIEGAPPSNNADNIPTASSINLSDYNEDAKALAADTVHFDYDSASLKKNEGAHVEAAVAAMRLDGVVKIRVEGNCDERGTEEYNRALGERRALAVREAMVKLGIDPERILTISYGEDKPAAPGHDESAWKQNRRADFVLLHPK